MHTRTFVLMKVSDTAYEEIRAKLLEASYDQALVNEGEDVVLDMHGIALKRVGEPGEDAAILDKLELMVSDGIVEFSYTEDGDTFYDLIDAVKARGLRAAITALTALEEK